MEMSAMTRSAQTRRRNMSSRMLPCSTISVVVEPAMPSSSRAGWMSLASTASKSTPALTPKGRMMKARVMAWPDSFRSGGRAAPSRHRQHAANELGLRARVRRAIAAKPRPQLELDALVFAHQLRVHAERIPEPEVIAPLAAVLLDQVHVMGALDAFFEREVVFELDPIGIFVAKACERRRALCDKGVRGYRDCDIEYRLRFQPGNRGAAYVLDVEREALERAAQLLGFESKEFGPTRRVVAQPDGSRRQTQHILAGARIKE